MYSIACVILPGTKLENLDTDKSLLKFDNKTLIEIIYERVNCIFDNIIICTETPENYDFLPIQKIKSFYPGFGTLSAIHATLKNFSIDKIFTISCDTPFVTCSLINHLLNIKTDELIIVPKARGIIHFTIGIYSKNILPITEEVLNANFIAKKIYEKKKPFCFNIENFLERVGAEIVDVEKEKFYFNDLFFNINTLDDYQYVKEKLV
ncbi:MAG: molybdenum cofactor guanylyltransferase [Melioribacter sp.]|nr:molybdenum cofactor guanylyltransferase [Melioribacter sp.]